jgi:hypothetical protein
VQGRWPRLKRVRLAALIGALVIAGAPQAFANPSETEASSVRLALESFAFTLKAKSEKAVQAATGAVEHGKAVCAELKRRGDARLETLRAALSEQKARLAIVREDAAASFATWRQAASQSWAELQRSAGDALGWFAEWVRRQSAPNAHSNIGA